MRRIHHRLESFFESIARWVYTHSILSLSLLVSVVLACQLPKLPIDTRDQSFFHPNDPTLAAYNQFRYQFGQDDIFFIAMQPENGLTPKAGVVFYQSGELPLFHDIGGNDQLFLELKISL